MSRLLLRRNRPCPLPLLTTGPSGLLPHNFRPCTFRLPSPPWQGLQTVCLGRWRTPKHCLQTHSSSAHMSSHLGHTVGQLFIWNLSLTVCPVFFFAKGTPQQKSHARTPPITPPGEGRKPRRLDPRHYSTEPGPARKASVLVYLGGSKIWQVGTEANSQHPEHHDKALVGLKRIVPGIPIHKVGTD